MNETIEQRLRVLEDREQIRELRATYCFLVDDERFDELVDRCFTDDACCDFRATDGSIQPLAPRGRDEVRAFFAQAVPALLSNMSHTIHNHRIAVNGDEASGDCYFELTAIDRATGTEVVGAGRYIDRYRRVNGRWRFAERRADMFYITSLAEGWSKRRFLAALRPAS
jgi:ketosteroid isomerase-like protein